MKRLFAILLFCVLVPCVYGETISYEFGTYIGEVVDGRPNGYGTFSYTKGGKYVGEHKDGQYHGYGTYTYASGSKYVGEFKDGQYHGHGTYFYASGSKYIGEYKDGKKNGQGTYTWANGTKYIGEYKNGNKNGQGTITFGKGEFEGDKYVGEFKDDKYDGQGIYTSKDRATIVGLFTNNAPSKGTLTHTRGTHEGEKYVGEFKDWEIHGKGSYTWLNGDRLVGQFRNDLPYKGTFEYGSGEYEGDKYVGAFKDWLFHGQGVYTRADKSKCVCEFKNQNPFNGVEYLASGAVWGTWIEGEWCGGCEPDTNQVQVSAIDSGSWNDAKNAFDQGNYSRALQLLLPYAEQGDSRAQFQVAQTYSKLERFVEAVTWARKAALQGNVRAALYLGRIYDFGEGVPEDDEAAVKWYRKAAEGGDAQAQFNLGSMYRYGLGVEQDDEEAFKWTRKSALQGNLNGQEALGRHYAAGRGVEQDYNEAFRWFSKSALQGDKDAESQIGWLYFWGNGVEQNYSEALSRWRNAANQGSAADMDNIAALYFNGLGVQKDYQTADRWLVRAARIADGDNVTGKAMMRALERQTEDSLTKEILGAYSCYALGIYYREGYVVDKNIDEAAMWFKKAIRMGSERGTEAFISLNPNNVVKTIEFFGSYEGEVLNDGPHGVGLWIHSESEGRYFGEWENGLKHGYGTFIWENGAKYFGEYKDGKQHGQGTYTWAAGDKYIGEHKNGQSHGQGTYFFADGNKYVGEYKDGEEWNGVRYLSSGKIWGTVSGGKPCKGCKPDSTQPAVAPDLSTLTVTSNPSNADIYIDNSYKGKTELEIELPPGYYSVRVEKSGYESFRQRIHLKQNMDLWASLTKKGGAESSLGSLELIGTGTGFVVNKDYVVTAEHVLEDCTAISIRHGHKEIDAKTVARDAANDLGLIRLSQPIWNTAKLRGGRPARKGERVSNYGYPLFGELADSATITQGNINNLSGLGNDSRFIQFDAPSQPGNSGGPVLDSSGNVVGVASHILSKKYADRTGHIAQNVNFAVKSYLVEGFLSSNDVSFEKAESTEELKLPDIAEKAEKFTVLVECWE